MDCDGDEYKGGKPSDGEDEEDEDLVASAQTKTGTKRKGGSKSTGAPRASTVATTKVSKVASSSGTKNAASTSKGSSAASGSSSVKGASSSQPKRSRQDEQGVDPLPSSGMGMTRTSSHSLVKRHRASSVPHCRATTPDTTNPPFPSTWATSHCTSGYRLRLACFSTCRCASNFDDEGQELKPQREESRRA